jgi:hypothetical protein
MRPTDSAVIIGHMIKHSASMQSPAVYRLCVIGKVPLDWSARLMDMNITRSDTEQDGEKTTLVGRLPDQAALSGVLNTLYEKQFPVLSVEFLEIG